VRYRIDERSIFSVKIIDIPIEDLPDMLSPTAACRPFLAIAAAASLLASVAAHAAPFAYVPLNGENQLAIVDLATNALVARLPTGRNPIGVSVNAGGNRVYVTNFDDGTVTVFDSLRNQVVSTIAVGADPVGVQVSPNGKTIAVANLGASASQASTTISLINAVNGQVAKVTVGSAPAVVSYDGSGSQLFVSNYLSHSISIIDTAGPRVTGTVNVAANPYSIAVNDAGTRVYAAHLRDSLGAQSLISVVDSTAARVVATIALDSDPQWIALNPAGTRLYVAKAVGSVSVIDTASNRLLFDFVMRVNAGPSGIEVSADGSRIYVVDNTNNEIAIFDAGSNRQVGSVSLGQKPIAFGNFVGPQTVSTGAEVPGPLSGVWWNPSESGWGIDFTQRGSNIFAAWFTYDSVGQPKWYVVPNCSMPAQNSCSGTVYQVTGPHYFGVEFNPAAANVTAVGSLSVNFSSNNAGVLSYTVNGISRTVGIERQMFASGPAPLINYTDLWWNPAESGWGMAITHQANVMFLAWYVYDDNGNPTWYVAPNCGVSAQGDGCAGRLYSTTGPPFGRNFDPTQVHTVDRGLVVLTFTDGNNGQIKYLVENIFLTKQITRQIF
jgi:YVTN family beta-propeller protein